MANVIRTINLEGVRDPMEGGLSTPGTSAGVTVRTRYGDEKLSLGMTGSCSLPICAPLRFVANKVLTAPPPDQPGKSVDKAIESLLLEATGILQGAAFSVTNPNDILNRTSFFIDLVERAQSILDKLEGIRTGNALSSEQLAELTHVKAMTLSIQARTFLSLSISAARDITKIEDIKKVPFLQGITDYTDLRKLAFDALERLLSLQIPEMGTEQILIVKWLTFAECIKYLQKLWMTLIPIATEKDMLEHFGRVSREMEPIVEWIMGKFYELNKSDFRNAELAENLWPMTGKLFCELSDLVASVALIPQRLEDEAGSEKDHVRLQEAKKTLDDLEYNCRDAAIQMAFGFSYIQPTDKKAGRVLAYLADQLAGYGTGRLEENAAHFPKNLPNAYFEEAIELLDAAEEKFAEQGMLRSCHKATLGRFFLITKIGGSEGRLQLKDFFDNIMPRNYAKLAANEYVGPVRALLYTQLIYLVVGRWEAAIPGIREAVANFEEDGEYVDVKMGLEEAAEKLREIAGNVDKKVVSLKGRSVGSELVAMAEEFEARAQKVAQYAKLQEEIEEIEADFLLPMSEEPAGEDDVDDDRLENENREEVGRLREMSSRLLILTAMALETRDRGLARYAVRFWGEIGRHSYFLSGRKTTPNLDRKTRSEMMDLHILANSKVLELGREDEFRGARIEALENLYDATGNKDYFDRYFVEMRQAIPAAATEGYKEKVEKFTSDWAHMLVLALKKGHLEDFFRMTKGEITWMRENGHADLSGELLLSLRAKIEAARFNMVDPRNDQRVVLMFFASAAVFTQLKFYGGAAASLVHAVGILAKRKSNLVPQCFKMANKCLEAFTYETIKASEQVKKGAVKEYVMLAGEWEEIADLTNELLKVDKNAYMMMLQLYAVAETVRFSEMILAGSPAEDSVPKKTRESLVETFRDTLKEWRIDGMVSRLSKLPECQGLSRVELQDTAIRLMVEYTRERSLMGTLSSSAALVDVFSEMDDEWLLTKVRRGKDARPSVIELFGVEKSWKEVSERGLPGLEGFKDHVR